MSTELTAAMDLNARIRIPASAAPGELIEVRTLVRHPMETGYRIDTRGQRVPRRIIERFRCHYADRLILDAHLRPAIAADPYLSFSFVADISGVVEMEWIEDSGASHREQRQLDVVALPGDEGGKEP